MHRSLTLAAFASAALTLTAEAHALLPGQQTVSTVGERAFVRFQALNGRRDVSEFVVEVFEGDSWTPSSRAVASPARFTVPAYSPDNPDASDRAFSVLVDLDGADLQKLRVCTKSVIRQNPLRAPMSRLNTRVCSNVTIRRFR